MITQVLNIVPVLDKLPVCKLLRRSDCFLRKPFGYLCTTAFLSSLRAGRGLRFRFPPRGFGSRTLRSGARRALSNCSS
jgi:hypothetical protein